MVFDKIKKAFSRSIGEDTGDEYLEIDLGKEEMEQKVFVKLFALKDYEEVNTILNSLREGYTIAVIDIKALRQRDSLELKRAVSKIKKTTDAMEGNIAGFGENVIIVTPSFAKIHKEPMPKPKDEKEVGRSRWD
ncbi:MAG: cell division protein SepF [Nanoarchaeota archaeon]